MHQVDTYFAVEQGRLKLREIVHTRPAGETTATAELIRYERPDEAGARVSAYERTELADPTETRAQLAAEHGIRGVVEKDRELWLVDATRIHLDRVVGLGDFVELETVCARRSDPGRARRARPRLPTARPRPGGQRRGLLRRPRFRYSSGSCTGFRTNSKMRRVSTCCTSGRAVNSSRTSRRKSSVSRTATWTR